MGGSENFSIEREIEKVKIFSHFPAFLLSILVDFYGTVFLALLIRLSVSPSDSFSFFLQSFSSRLFMIGGG